MIGVNIGSLNATISYGQQQSANRLTCNLIISDISGRETPVIITYTKSHRLIGDQAKLIIKKNMNSSFNNLCRLVGIEPNSDFTKNEIANYLLLGSPFNLQTKSFNVQLDNTNTIQLSPDQIVLAFLSILKQELLFNKKIPLDCIVFSIADYFTCSQKYAFLSILKAAGFEKNCHMIQESTAITLYFGHKKYKDYFVVKDALSGNTAGVNPTIVKYIIFIDAGYSKTNFIFSKLSYNQFSVLKCFCLPFLGGRDFDQKIFQFCAGKFYNEKGIDISSNKKVILRLLTSIEKCRRNLTVNRDSTISCDSIADGEDFTYVLKREEFESIIKDQLQLFESKFTAFYNDCQNLLSEKGLLVTDIEMAGDLMRTPCLQEIVKKISGIEISKTIMVDECVAIGCSLYAAIMKGCFPIQNFQGIYHVNNYSIYYRINNSQLMPFVLAQTNIPFIKSIKYTRNEIRTNTLNIGFYHDKNEINYYLPCKTGLLLEFEINLKNLVSHYKNLEEFEIVFLVDNNGFVHVHGMNIQEKGEKKQISSQLIQKVIKTTQRELYQSNITMNNNIQKLKLEEKNMIERDIKYKQYLEKLNNLENKYYTVKNKVANKNINGLKINGIDVNEILSNIEEQINNCRDTESDITVFDLQLEDILNAIIPNSVYKLTSALKQRIKNYQEILNVQLCNIIEGNASKLTQEDIEKISNILIHFEKQLNICDNNNDFKTINDEFEAEMKNYVSIFK